MLLCSASHVAEVVVEDAQVRRKCLLPDGRSCTCDGLLKLRIERVLGVRNSVATYPESVGIDANSVIQVTWQTSFYPPVSDEVAVCEQRGKDMSQHTFIASIATTYGLWSDGTRHVSHQPYYAMLWERKREPWAVDIVSGSSGEDCPAARNLR
jgi:hypothetical protein